jgi:hypothetical protein
MMKHKKKIGSILANVGKPILQAKWSGFFAFGSISNFILAMLISLFFVSMFLEWIPFNS